MAENGNSQVPERQEGKLPASDTRGHLSRELGMLVKEGTTFPLDLIK